MFFWRLFKNISKDNNIDYYSIHLGNEEKWNDKARNCIICPIRSVPLDYDKNLKYIIHIRNPLDTLISQYYSFGFTHISPTKNSPKYKAFIERRKKIQSQSIDEYCLSLANISEINNKYNDMFNWIEKYKKNENVFISKYDNMYYDFSNWLKAIFKFLSLKKI